MRTLVAHRSAIARVARISPGNTRFTAEGVMLWGGGPDRDVGSAAGGTAVTTADGSSHHDRPTNLR